MGCEQYKDEGEMEGDHICPLHKKLCVARKEDNFFFRLSRYQKQIEVRHALFTQSCWLTAVGLRNRSLTDALAGAHASATSISLTNVQATEY